MPTERIHCRECGDQFGIDEEEKALLGKLSPVVGGKWHLLPLPTLCFPCRLRRRLAFYNCRSLYRRTCSDTGENIVSIYSPDKHFKVISHGEWWSDRFDPLAYGRDIDFSRPFFGQFRELMEDVPLIALSVLGDNVNSEFTNDNYKSKNCYMVFDGEQAENAYHGHTFVGIKTCLDFLALEQSELCYECTHCRECYNLKCSRFSTNCRDSWYLRDCIACRNCFCCANLRQREYCLFNEQKTKADYEVFLMQFASSKQSVFSATKLRAEEFFLSQPVKAVRNLQVVDSIGDNLKNCKNAVSCFDCNELQDCRYCTDCLMGGKDNMDIHVWGEAMEQCYNCCLIGANIRNILCCHYVIHGADSVFYSFWCAQNAKNLFGCIGLRKKEFCILNKQYTRVQYEELVSRIIAHMRQTGEWGEFFPPSVSTFGYNETMAQSFFPLQKEEAIRRGFQWSDFTPSVEADRTIQASQLPDDTKDIPDDILNWALVCEATGKPFKLIPQELALYRRWNLPIPRRHPDQRHFDRFAFKNAYQLWKRKCGKCGKEISTTFSPERPEKVYCEECYLEEVY